ncbi:hypothetical protein Dimus_008909 [Dionaea muscipula]
MDRVPLATRAHCLPTGCASSLPAAGYTGRPHGHWSRLVLLAANDGCSCEEEVPATGAHCSVERLPTTGARCSVERLPAAGARCSVAAWSSQGLQLLAARMEASTTRARARLATATCCSPGSATARRSSVCVLLPNRCRCSPSANAHCSPRPGDGAVARHYAMQLEAARYPIFHVRQLCMDSMHGHAWPWKAYVDGRFTIVCMELPTLVVITCMVMDRWKPGRARRWLYRPVGHATLVAAWRSSCPLVSLVARRRSSGRTKGRLSADVTGRVEEIQWPHGLTSRRRVPLAARAHCLPTGRASSLPAAGSAGRLHGHWPRLVLLAADDGCSCEEEVPAAGARCSVERLPTTGARCSVERLPAAGARCSVAAWSSQGLQLLAARIEAFTTRAWARLATATCCSPGSATARRSSACVLLPNRCRCSPSANTHCSPRPRDGAIARHYAM